MRARVTPFSRGLIFTPSHVSLALKSPMENEDDSSRLKRGSSSLHETFTLDSQFEAVQQPAQSPPQALRSFINSSVKTSSSLTTTLVQ